MSNVEQLYVGLPVPLVSELLKRYPDGFTGVIEYVIEDFLKRTHEDFYVLRNKTDQGIKWGNVFLPVHTELRTYYFKKYIQAVVGDGCVLWEGECFDSIPSLVNKMRGGTMNNAWISLEIKYPNSEKWIKADDLRKK